MSASWANQAVFYHIYPLGMLGAPRQNDFNAPPVPRLKKLHGWLDHIQGLGVNALYLGPLFESSRHGYDTVDYYTVDRRLGTRETLAGLSREIHRRGMRLVLDGVFNHTGRDFWAFRDLLAHGQNSAYRDWYCNLDFHRTSPFGDPFSYEGWSGHYDLVKLNLHNLAVRQHLFEAIRMWVETFDIDGLRLDAADQLAPEFLTELAAFCRSLRSDFWLMGEIVFGDYRRLANPQMLDSATNYECYKALYSSHNDRNYFEIGYALNRLFGPQGIYRDLCLYSFADNHDVDRVASSLTNPAHLSPLYCLLFSMPGAPSIYYGSEWGLSGKRTSHSDEALRPALELSQAANLPHPELAGTITRLAQLRKQSPALYQGDYQELLTASEQLAFLRRSAEQQMVVAVNAAPEPVEVDLRLPVREGKLVDLLNAGETFEIRNHQVRVEPLPPHWARIMEVKEEVL